MKKAHFLFLAFLIIVVGSIIIISGNSDKNNLAGFVVFSSNENSTYVLGTIIAFLVLVAAGSYFYSIHKFGPA